jgi:DNA-binding PadR family transcriptional regulator
MFEQLKEFRREYRDACRTEQTEQGDRRSEHRDRHRFGGFGGGRWHGAERGFGGGRERFFDSGQLRLVILQLIAEKPSYGYEIMKAIEERLAGSYAPSPGVVYPTLTLLEEEGMAAVASSEGNKKRYEATEQGREYLKENRGALKAILGRMDHAGKAFGSGRSPQINRAVMNLMMAFKMRLRRGELSAEQARKIAEAIDAAARAIDEA